MELHKPTGSLLAMMDAGSLELGYPEHETDWAKYIEEYTESHDKYFDYSPHGFIAGVRTLDYLHLSGIPTAIEVAWYVVPSKRGMGEGMKLYDSFSFWAEKSGCEYIVQGKPTKGCTKVGNLYLRKL